MIKNFFKIAIRNLLKYKGYTIINVLGLAVGITGVILTMLFVRNEFSYDRFHSKSDRIYRLWQFEKYADQQLQSTSTPLSAASVIAASYPEVEASCRLYGFNSMVTIGQNSFTEQISMVDTSFFRVFDFQLIEGDAHDPFPSNNSIVVTPETAVRYFGTESALGKTIELVLNDKKTLFKVTGIVEQAPTASSIQYNALIPFSNEASLFNARARVSWFQIYVQTFVLTKEHVSAAALEMKFPKMIEEYLAERYTEGGFQFYLQPLADVYFGNTLPTGLDAASDPKYAYILGTISILILLVACMNFILLAIGRSTTRAKEVGIRKVLGSARKQLMFQFWMEAFLLTLAAMVLGFVLSVILLKPFNFIANRELAFQIDTTFLLSGLALLVAITCLAGFYPSFVLSGFKPAAVLKGKLKIKSGGDWLQQSLVVGQFCTSIAMIVCTIVIGKQMDFLKNKHLGYDKEEVVIVPTNMNIAESRQLIQLYRTELTKYPEVREVASSFYSFAESPWIAVGFTEESGAYRTFQYNTVDEHFIGTMDISLVNGRPFSMENPADRTTAAVVNEAFVKTFGLTDPIGKKLPGPFNQQIIGVVEDFHFESLHTEIRPLLLTMQLDSVIRHAENIDFTASGQPRMAVRMKAGSLSANVDILRRAWKVVAPDRDFEYRFLDETLASQYQQEQRMSILVKVASFLSIFIACMGLFGLATLRVAMRNKEIGVRKVLGATITGIVTLLSKDFVKLVCLAIVIASPIAWWAMNTWLTDFAYRITMRWWMFVLAGLSTLSIALITVSWQAVRAAVTNPVKALRDE